MLWCWAESSRQFKPSLSKSYFPPQKILKSYCAAQLLLNYVTFIYLFVFFWHSLAPEREKWKINVCWWTWHELADWLAGGQRGNKWMGNTMLLGINVRVMTAANESKWLSAPEMQLIERKSNTFIIWRVFFFFCAFPRFVSQATQIINKRCAPAIVIKSHKDVAEIKYTFIVIAWFVLLSFYTHPKLQISAENLQISLRSHSTPSRGWKASLPEPGPDALIY